ncbi:hypothetical protein DAPPUDRAFT_235922 [Daphnia pulex]|uniref:Uncharacterized protein n=1 Tax=Daphnia pulex TaxID=6669 RepID=E9FZE9_DAPPU|nr:hypothetical protein DAPPUDRAFT_235922 [Daphnia pulex]|eukprot:EFX87041.1 hypothetical protein DAPPUDRAFT_235922 [Daphnia pulex]
MCNPGSMLRPRAPTVDSRCRQIGLVRMTSFKRFQSAITERTNPPRQGPLKY